MTTEENISLGNTFKNTKAHNFSGLLSNFFLFTILFAVSTSTGLVLPLLLPHPSQIAFSLLSIVLIVYMISGRSIYANASMIKSLCILVFLFMFYGLSQKTTTDSIMAYLQPAALIFTLMLLFLYTMAEEFTRLLKIYVIFCFIMALCGLIAWVLINGQFVDLRDSFWSLFESTTGRASRDEGGGWGGTNYGYSFPYGLGLVLTGSYAYDVFGLIFFRASGWAHEPTTAASFIAPALILMAREQLFSRRIRWIFFVTLFAFWTACAAIGSVAAFLFLIVFYLMFSRGKYLFLKRILALVLLMAMYEVYQNVQTLFASVSGYQSLLASKFSPEGDINRSLGVLSPKTLEDVIQVVMFLLMAGTVLFFAVQAMRSRNANAVTFALILVYFVLHSLKGDATHVFASYLMMLFFFIFLRVSISDWQIIKPLHRRVKIPCAAL